jgi:hypothetical protein
MPIDPNKMYSWEIELLDKSVHKQFKEDNTENSWKDLPADSIVRVTFVPAIKVLPKHSIMIDPTKGYNMFVKRFGRGFLKQGSDGIRLREYLNCVITKKYRLYVFSNGTSIVTHPNYEIYL